MNRLIVTLSIPLIFTLSCEVFAGDEAVLHACQKVVAKKFTQWRFAPLTDEVAEYAKSQHINPTVTYGDFDGDGRNDVALLIQHGANPDPQYPGRGNSLHIAVCLNTLKGFKFYLIDNPYCGDGIATSLKGRRYYDYNTDKKGTFRHDGVAAYCFEKAGATYQFQNGAFHEIVDSD
jgi:hypothetical protein